jgi:hypothetical protein
MKKNSSMLTVAVLVVIIGLTLYVQKHSPTVSITPTVTAPDETQTVETPPDTTTPTVTPPVTTPPATNGTVTPIVTTPPATNGEVDITLDDNNKTITMRPDETFLLKFGEAYDWQPVIDNQDVVSRVIGIALIRGAQGLYKAHKEGTAILTATGDPLCRQSTPPCGAPSILFKININVTAQ